MKRSLFVLIAVMTLAIVMPAHATLDDGNRYGIGLQWMDPIDFGPSFTVDMPGVPLSLQAILGSNEFPSPAGRVRFVFANRQYLDGYAYGAIGFVNHDYPEDHPDDDLEAFFGIGGGVEWDWRDADPDLPPISWSLELGYAYEDLSFGFGVHYTF